MTDDKKNLTAAVIITLIITHMSYILAGCVDESGTLSFISIINELPNKLSHPFGLYVTKYTATGIVAGLFLGAFFGAYFYFSRKTWMYGKEHGSARWGNAKRITKKMTTLPKGMKREDAPYERILSCNMRMNMSDKITDLNNNILLVAGPGRGKTFRVIGPNILQCNGSIILTDPKKELLRIYGNYLKANGYDVRVIDLIDFELSDCYNPLKHIENDDKLTEVVETIWASMEDPKAQKGEAVWEDSAKALVESLMFYIYYEMEEKDRTIRKLLELLTELSMEDKGLGLKEMKKKMTQLYRNNPKHPAPKKFFQAMNGAEQSVKSVMFSATSKLSKMESEGLLKILDHDTIDYKAMGMDTDKKTALFLCIKDGDTRWNFMVSIAVMQAFDELYYAADHNGGRLPVPVSCWLDEFRNVPLPKRFPELLSTMRGRNISSIITIQDPSQLEALYKEEKHTVIGDCETIIYMGGGDIDTFEWISKQLGTMTIYKRSQGKTYGNHGNDSSNVDVMSRELMKPDEVGRLSTKKQIVIIRGEYPVIDSKYQTQNSPKFHAAIKLGPYIHTPNRGDRNEGEKGEEGADNKRNIFGEALTEEQFLEYKHRMEKGENIIIHDLRSEAEKNGGDTEGGINVEKELRNLNDYKSLSAEQKKIVEQVVASGIRAEELNDLDLKNMTADQIRTTMEGFYGLSFGK
jgi:type IV secretion system protein VirD4